MVSTRRAPLSELPLFDFLPPPNTCIPSPLSLPSKRGPPTPRAGTSTPKRPRPACALHSDELGTGKSPARRLFADEPATPTPKKITSKLAPSPPLTSKTPAQTPDKRRLAVHDVGFVIFQDEASPTTTPVKAERVRDEENIPPVPAVSVEKPTPRARRKVCIR